MKMSKITNRKAWSDSDNEKIHSLYLKMIAAMNNDEKINKSKMFTELGESLGRSKSSCECKAMNISAIYQNLLNRDYVKGLKPLNNYNHSLAKTVCAFYGVDYET